MTKQQPTCFGQRDGPLSARTVDQALTREGLERPDVIADAGLGGVQDLRCGPERPRRRDRSQGAQMLEFDACPIIRYSDIFSYK
jgi:hypothetical protein